MTLEQDTPSRASAPWGPVPPARTTGTDRDRIRALRADSGVLLAVLDDDPTGSQAVHGLDIVFVLEAAAYARALSTATPSCFVLTNTRSEPAERAAAVNRRVAADLHDVAAALDQPLQLVSRSDSTLRGHVITEVDALSEVIGERGRQVDAVLFAPAFLEAGRVTVDDVHWSRVGETWVPVGETEFAQDATFGYRSSNLRDFVCEISSGRVARDDVLSISLDDIRLGGPERVRDVIAGARDGAFVVVNALDYADLECVALAALECRVAGQSLLYRTGPSMVRAMDGQEPRDPLTVEEIAAARPALDATEGTTRHGLVVVGSHVAQTARQVTALDTDGNVELIVLEVPELLQLGQVQLDRSISRYAAQVADALRSSDVVLMTSRTLVRGADPESSLDIARTVSGALSDVVRASLDQPPAWVVAKGGITSHDIAVRGLGASRARVEGQLFPGLISLFRLVEADPRVRDRPYVVFPGNVGDDQALLEVVRRLRAASLRSRG
jgi:uncharacterized protein YgbK (DUF1537 family)